MGKSSISAGLYGDAPIIPGVNEQFVGPPRELAPVKRTERISSLDILRGIALLGILVVNIEDFSGPEALHDIPVGMGKPAFAGPHAHLSLMVLLLKWIFVENKMRGLFSMLFGAGVILFTMSGDRTSTERSADTFHRRNMWLVVLGILHGTLIWGGDILAIYGMNALLLLYPFRRLKSRTLLILGTIVWIVGATGVYMIHFHGFDILATSQKMAVVRANQQSGRLLTSDDKKTQDLWKDIQAPMHTWGHTSTPTSIDPKDAQDEIKDNTRGYLDYVRGEGSVFLGALFQGYSRGVALDTIGAMLLGMALFKNGFLSAERSLSTYFFTAAVGYLISIPLTIFTLLKAYAAGFSVLSMAQIYSTALLSAEAGALAIAATLLIMCKSSFFRPLLRPFAAVGQTALSNYLLTSILCQWAFRFGPWKLYGQLEYCQEIFAVFAMWAINLVVSQLWLRTFEFGPCEWLWRSLTYWKLQPMRRPMAVQMNFAEAGAN